MTIVVDAGSVDVIIIEAWGRRFRLTPDRPGRALDRDPGGHAESPKDTIPALIAECAEDVARRSGIPLGRMRGPFRHGNVARARMAAMWLAHERHRIHPHELAVFFHRHRTTVLHALAVVALGLRAGGDDANQWLSILPANFRPRTGTSVGDAAITPHGRNLGQQIAETPVEGDPSCTTQSAI